MYQFTDPEELETITIDLETYNNWFIIERFISLETPSNIVHFL